MRVIIYYIILLILKVFRKKWDYRFPKDAYQKFEADTLLLRFLKEKILPEEDMEEVRYYFKNYYKNTFGL